MDVEKIEFDPRRPGRGVIHHASPVSDRGIKNYKEVFLRHGIVSPEGYCLWAAGLLFLYTFSGDNNFLTVARTSVGFTRENLTEDKEWARGELRDPLRMVPESQIKEAVKGFPARMKDQETWTWVKPEEVLGFIDIGNGDGADDIRNGAMDMQRRLYAGEIDEPGICEETRKLVLPKWVYLEREHKETSIVSLAGSIVETGMLAIMRVLTGYAKLAPGHERIREMVGYFEKMRLGSLWHKNCQETVLAGSEETWKNLRVGENEILMRLNGI